MKIDHLLRSGRSMLAVAVLTLSVLAAGSASAVVLHPGDQGPAERPDDAFVGKWLRGDGTLRASAVALIENVILTANHIGGSVGETVEFDGVEYAITSMTQYGNTDIRLATIGSHNGGPSALDPDSVVGTDNLYTGRFENQEMFVVGGYGATRGDAVGGGYLWGASPTDGPQWGANRVEGFANARPSPDGSAVSSTFWYDFDAAGDPTRVAHEATLGDRDSGAGAFIYAPTGPDDDQPWKLVGLGAYVQHDGTAYYDGPGAAAGEMGWMLRISSYADGLFSAAEAATPIPEPATVAVLGLGGLALLRRRRA